MCLGGGAGMFPSMLPPEKARKKLIKILTHTAPVLVSENVA